MRTLYVLVLVGTVMVWTSLGSAGEKILLNQSGGGTTEMGGTGDSAKVTQGTFGPGENATAQALSQIYVSNSGIPIRYTTTGDKNVKSTPGEVVRVLAASGTSVTVAFYDDADGTCSSSQVLGTTTLTNGRSEPLDMRFSVGICMVVGGTSPDLTLVYK